MKRLLTLAFLAISAHAAQPTQADLDAALEQAAAAWGHSVADANIARVILADLGPCKPPRIMAAWSDFATRVITLNSQCQWVTHGSIGGKHQPLEESLLHEFCHMLTNSAAHSMNPKSVCYWQLAKGQRILPEDLERINPDRALVDISQKTR